MKIMNYGTYKEILPDEGKVLFDGDSYTTAVCMPVDGDMSIWQEVDESEQINEEEHEL